MNMGNDSVKIVETIPKERLSRITMFFEFEGFNMEMKILAQAVRPDNCEGNERLGLLHFSGELRT